MKNLSGSLHLQATQLCLLIRYHLWRSQNKKLRRKNKKKSRSNSSSSQYLGSNSGSISLSIRNNSVGAAHFDRTWVIYFMQSLVLGPWKRLLGEAAFRGNGLANQWKSRLIVRMGIVKRGLKLRSNRRIGLSGFSILVARTENMKEEYRIEWNSLSL